MGGVVDVMRWKWLLKPAVVASTWALDVLGRIPGAQYPRFLSLSRRADRALDRNATRAAVLANELLTLAEKYQTDWNYGNAVHHAHIVLGRIALSAGDLATARKELILAGATPGSPQLNSFGPNMLLARDLLLAGETAVVLEYFALCARFWIRKVSSLEAWAATVRANRIPDFGPNLRYPW